MKRLRLSVFVFITFVCLLPLSAQENGKSQAADESNWSEYYYINLPIEKIYSHELGYVVAYRKSGSTLGRAYIPLKWFSEAAGKGELARISSGTTWPYISIYYKNGVFDHVRLHVRKDLSHESWGYLPPGTNIDDKFNVEELKLEF